MNDAELAIKTRVKENHQKQVEELERDFEGKGLLYCYANQVVMIKVEAILASRDNASCEKNRDLIQEIENNLGRGFDRFDYSGDSINPCYHKSFRGDACDDLALEVTKKLAMVGGKILDLTFDGRRGKVKVDVVLDFSEDLSLSGQTARSEEADQ